MLRPTPIISLSRVAIAVKVPAGAPTINELTNNLSPAFIWASCSSITPLYLSTIAVYSLVRDAKLALSSATNSSILALASLSSSSCLMSSATFSNSFNQESIESDNDANNLTYTETSNWCFLPCFSTSSVISITWSFVDSAILVAFSTSSVVETLGSFISYTDTHCSGASLIVASTSFVSANLFSV